MPSTSKTFVDPSALSLPSPQSDAHDSPSPSPSHADSQPGPSRKRARTDISPEERREARAHRNRIAAQNSRDKRKAQFTALERRVAELEEENRQLRAGISSTEPQRPDSQRQEEAERDRARERENAELKERIKSLENGWEAVMKVLASQGLSNKLPSTAPTSAPAPPSPPTSNSPQTFPVLVPSSPVFPITPSPTLSASSNFFDLDEPMPMSVEPTRHLARVATVAAGAAATSLQRVDSINRRTHLLTSPPPPLPSLSSLLQRPSLCRRLPPLARRQRTRLPWTHGSAKSLSRALPPCRRRLFLLTTSKNQRRPPFPPPRRRPERR